MKLILIIFVMLIALNESYAQLNKETEILKKRLSFETFQEWDSFIKKYAPSDSALRVVSHFARQHYISGRAILAYEVLTMYEKLFSERKEFFEKEKATLLQIALTQPITNDLIGYFVKYINLNPEKHNSFLAVQRLSEQFINRRDWDSAAFIYNTFKPLLKNYSKEIERIVSILKAPEEKIKIRNLGTNINTSGSEWDPNPSPDGRYLYFSADHRRGGKGGSDVWISEMQDGFWQKAQNLSIGLNGTKDETIDNISVDGNTLLLSGNLEGTFGRFDIYFKEKTESGWSNLYHYPLPINSEYTDEGANLTADGKALLFSSDRPGGIGEYKPLGELYNGGTQGNMDIYVCLRKDSGWSKPINLGSVINTQYSERSPFLHPDGKTLYFSSDGHPGLGRLDLFKSVRLREDSWTEWSEPINLGKEINSGGDDWGYKISVSGDSAFFSGFNRSDGYGAWDIYSVSLPKNAKPEKVSIIRGKVLNSKSMPLAAEIVWEDLESKQVVGKMRSNPQDGSYFIALPLGKLYGYYAEKKGYYPASDNIDLRKTNKDVYQDIILSSVSELKSSDEHITVKNIFFDYNKYELKAESFPELDRLAGFIKANKIKAVKIIGHTDSIGTDEFNIELSKKRANAVKAYLIGKGIPESSININGLGSSKPIDTNANENGRAKNRRVEIYFE